MQEIKCAVYTRKSESCRFGDSAGAGVLRSWVLPGKILYAGGASRAIFLAKQLFVYWSPYLQKSLCLRVLMILGFRRLVTGHFRLVT